MIINRLKDIAIIALTALALYLTGQLWFEEISNRNFFYMLSSWISPSEPQITDQRITISTPSRIITNFGNLAYGVSYNGLDKSKTGDICHEVISDTLRYGEFIGSQELDWNMALRSRSFIYEYKFHIPASLFVMGFTQSNNILSSRVKNFAYIVIVPNRVNSESVRIYFIDEQGGQLYEYSLARNALTLNQKLQDCLQKTLDLSDSDNSIPIYSSSKQSGLEIFAENAFIPEIGQHGLHYNKIAIINPYMTNNELLLNPIEKKMKAFFDNPAMMSTGLTNNTIYTFSDESTIIKYYPNDVVEYSNYQVIDKRNPSTFNSDFNAAVSFILKDREINNDFFFVDYIYDDGKHTFYFDFAINDIPMILSEDCKYETGLTHPIEITVENGWVTKYKKLVYNYVVLDGPVSMATLDYIDFISMLIDESGGDSLEARLSDITLCYKIDRKSPLTLYWFIRVNNRIVTRSAGV